MGQKTVVLNYGPYEFMGVVNYRVNRLRGIVARLKSADVSVVKRKIPSHDTLEVEVLGTIIYTCRLTLIEYDGDGHDPNSEQAVWRAIRALKAISAKMMMQWENDLTAGLLLPRTYTFNPRQDPIRFFTDRCGTCASESSDNTHISDVPTNMSVPSLTELGGTTEALIKPFMKKELHLAISSRGSTQ